MAAPGLPSRGTLAALLTLLITGISGTPAGAQQAPICDAKNAGAMSCQAGVRCKCAFHRGGLMIAEPEGYRWDCSPLNGSCYTDVPATTSRIEGPPKPPPPAPPPGTVIVPTPAPHPLR